jgi:hypothetical protein
MEAQAQHPQVLSYRACEVLAVGKVSSKTEIFSIDHVCETPLDSRFRRSCAANSSDRGRSSLEDWMSVTIANLRDIDTKDKIRGGRNMRL